MDRGPEASVWAVNRRRGRTTVTKWRWPANKARCVGEGCGERRKQTTNDEPRQWTAMPLRSQRPTSQIPTAHLSEGALTGATKSCCENVADDRYGSYERAE